MELLVWVGRLKVKFVNVVVRMNRLVLMMLLILRRRIT